MGLRLLKENSNISTHHCSLTPLHTIPDQTVKWKDLWTVSEEH